MQRFWTTSAFSAALLFAALPAAAASPHVRTHNTPVKTLVMQVRPVDSGGHLKPGFTITHRYSHAECEPGSDATNNAYRCFAKNFVIDPCWVGSTANVAFCQIEPWDTHVVRLHVHKFGAGPLGPRARNPWGVKLPNGNRCDFIQGAAGQVKGRRINYSCQHGKAVLVGNVHKTHEPWTIRTATLHGDHYTLGPAILIATAWFGAKSRKG